jgi:FkbM family methyltransferase
VSSPISFNPSFSVNLQRSHHILPHTKEFLKAIARKLASWPLRALPMHLGARALEDLADNMVSVTAVPNGQILFHTPTPTLIWRAHTLLIKELDTIGWIDRFIKGSVFWDIGANVGTYSLYAAIRREVSVLAFEPMAANFYVLNKNIQLNAVDNRVYAYCIALSDRTDLGVLNMASGAMGAAVSQFGKAGEMSRYAEENVSGWTQGMIAFSIDDFIRHFDPPFPNYVKVDVDGLEPAVLQGARETLCNPRLNSLMIELNVSDNEEYLGAVRLLKESGLRLVSRGVIQGTKEEVCANHLFERA